MSFAQTLALVGSLAASVSAHGYVQGIVAAGTYYQGYNPSFQYASQPPTVAGWSDPENLSNGYVAPSAYADPDIICHLDATPGGTSLKVAGGDTVELQWTVWPESHHGPVIDYLAKCTGDCTEVDKTTLEFFKISESGLNDGSVAPGTWASDDLIANNNSWTVTIPTDIVSGNYVLRHEIIALHSAGDANGAQNYPQCINLEITSDGTDAPAGTLGTALYNEDDPGILVNIYTVLETYTIPGPALYDGANAAAPTATAAPTSIGSSTSYIEARSTAAASSSPAVEATYTNSSTTTTSLESTSVPSITASPEEPSSTPEAEATVTSECTTTVYVTVTAYDSDSSSQSQEPYHPHHPRALHRRRNR